MVPIRIFTFKKGMSLYCRVYLTAGSMKEIEARFGKLQYNR